MRCYLAWKRSLHSLWRVRGFWTMKSVACLCVFLGFVQCSHPDRPVIGVLSEEFSANGTASSSIVSSYVKFVEGSGARVLPILVYKPEEYYRDILEKVNGVLFPGGGDILNSTGYGRAGKIIFHLAVQMNERGDYFPLWGTCLGFELLNLAAARRTWMKRCKAEDLASNVRFTKDAGRMFSGLPAALKEEMQRHLLAFHLHHWCITPENYSLSGLDRYFRVLALNADSENTTFVSVIEAFRYPFYGVSFHPEKVVYDWSPYYRIPHGEEAVRAAHFFGNFFIGEARKSSHQFPSESEGELIYNFSPQRDPTESDPSAQVYVFNSS